MYQLIRYSSEHRNEVLQSGLVNEKYLKKYLNRGFPWFWFKVIGIQQSYFYLIQNLESNEIVGAGCIRKRMNLKTFSYGFWLYGIVVKESLRGKGLGYVVMELLMKQVKAKELYLTVDVSNIPAITLYQNIGFTVIAQKGSAVVMRFAT